LEIALNRHERRRAKILEQKRQRVSLAELEKMVARRMCAWDGCVAHFTGDMPRGWVWLMAYWAKQPVLAPARDVPYADMPRDCALCPEHAAAFDRLLKDLGRGLDAPAAGSA
jgi:hypothetical protein